jgi:DNA-binding NtrC family response regulator
MDNARNSDRLRDRNAPSQGGGDAAARPDECGTVLVVDDDASHTRIVTRWLQSAGHKVIAASTGAEALSVVESVAPDLVLLDLHLADMVGLDVLRALDHAHSDLPVLMLTADRGVDHVVQAMRLGAADYLVKPLDRTRLVISVQNALEKGRMAQRLRTLGHAVEEGGFSGIIGRSPPMLELFRQVERVANSDITVLIHGQSGTGKELVASAIHDNSRRQSGPFVALNCAAIPEHLQESELFGHEKGSFTGASVRRAGHFELANGGTLFLDEVAELSPALQAKLLRVIQERRFFRVGGSVEIEVDVRIVSATHRDVTEMVRQGQFREDLYFRLGVFEISVPALRERGNDILDLAQHFAQRFAQGPRPPVLTHEVRDLLLSYGWPGNVRELQNAMERAVLLSDDGPIDIADLPSALRGHWTRGSVADVAVETHQRRPASPPPVLRAIEGSGGRTMADIERVSIVHALSATEGSVTAAAKHLGIPRTTFYRKLHKYNLL